MNRDKTIEMILDQYKQLEEYCEQLKERIKELEEDD